MGEKRFNAAFVSATKPRPTWGEWWRGLFQRRRRTPPAQVSHRVAIALRTWETPSHIQAIRHDRALALRLLGLRCSRRDWVRSGYSQRSWVRARAILRNARVVRLDGQNTVWLYSGRDAYLRVEAYMQAAEEKCWNNGKYLLP